MRKRLAASAATTGGILVAVLAGGAPAMAGVTGPAFYVDGALYRTVGTPTELSRTGAPAHSWDVIYEFFGAQSRNVATAAPGDPDYNGGRWQVHGLSFPNGFAGALESGDLDNNGILDSDAEIEAAIAAGDATDIGVVRQFVCPVIPLPRNA
jgi:hypothetical protein